MSVHGATSAQGRVTVVRRCGVSACSSAAALVNKHQHLTRRGASQLPSSLSWTHCSRKRVACRAEQQEQEQDQVDPELVPQRDPATTTRPLQDVNLVPTLGALFVLGALVGPPLDSLHSGVRLLVYDKFPVTIGSWRTSLADAPLLGLYYAVGGAILLALDDVWGTTETKRRIAARCTPGWVLLSFGLLYAYLSWSSKLYVADTPYSLIWGVLVVVGATGWWSIDSTRQGLALALVAAAVCPAAEILLMNVGGLWHYPHPDAFGIVSWVSCCYAFYTVVVGNLARWLAVTLSREKLKL
jgi:hypothetical protein